MTEAVALERPSARASLMLPPDWRWQAAMRYVREGREGTTPAIPNDPVVQYTARALKAWGSVSARDWMLATWPVMEEVLYYGTTARRSAVASEMEACLIRGWNHSQAEAAGMVLSRPVYDLFAKVFFDLTGMRAVHAWIDDFLFEPLRTQGGSRQLRSRLLAYHGGNGAGINTAVAGMLTAEEKGLLTTMMEGERAKRVFDYVMERTGLSRDTYATLMEGALKAMSEHEFQSRMRDRDEAGSGSLEELASNLEEGMRAYSQNELDRHDAAGLDFVNRYTAAILGRGTDGEGDDKG